MSEDGHTAVATTGGLDPSLETDFEFGDFVESDSADFVSQEHDISPKDVATSNCADHLDKEATAELSPLGVNGGRIDDVLLNGDNHHDGEGSSDDLPESIALAADETEDDFGGFDSAPPSLDELPPANARLVDDDPQVDTAGSPADEALTTAEHARDNGGSFEDFDSAASSGGMQLDAPELPVDALDSGLSADEAAVVTDAGNDDSFGDSGSAVPSGEQQTRQDMDSVDTGLSADIVAPSPDDQNDDSFGDFDDGAPVSSALIPPTIDDGSGLQFADIPANGMAQAEDGPGEAPDVGHDFDAHDADHMKQNSQDDDFGDFGDADAKRMNGGHDVKKTSENGDQIGEQVAVFEADDDFGDFDSALAEAPDKEVGEVRLKDGINSMGEGAETPDPEDDEDDFGDFDAAPAVEPIDNTGEEEEDDDFGDFNESTTAQPVAASSSQPAVPEGALSQKARSLFGRLFEACAPSINNDDPTEDSDQSEDVSVSSILTRLLECTDDVTLQHNAALIAQLNDRSVYPTASPAAIVTDDARGPFDHYLLPLSGLVGSARSIANGRPKPLSRRMSAPSLPESLHVQLSSPKETPRETLSVAAEAKLPSAPQLDKVQPKAPPAPMPLAKEAEADQPTEPVKHFLAQIPDLSFMLSSELTPR